MLSSECVCGGCTVQAASFPQSPFSAAFPELQQHLQICLCVSPPPLPTSLCEPQNREEEQEGMGVSLSGSADLRGPGAFVLVS